MDGLGDNHFNNVTEICNVTVASDSVTNISTVFLPNGLYATQFPGNGTVLLRFNRESNLSTMITAGRGMFSDEIPFAANPNDTIVITPGKKLNFSEIDLAGKKTFLPGGVAIGQWSAGHDFATLIYFDVGAVVVYDHFGNESLVRVSPRLDAFSGGRFKKAALTGAGTFNSTWMIMMESPGYWHNEEMAIEQRSRNASG